MLSLPKRLRYHLDAPELQNAVLHYHVIVIDGLFTGDDAGGPRFQEVCLAPKGRAQLQGYPQSDRA